MTAIDLHISAKLKAAEMPAAGYHQHHALAFSQLQRCGVWTIDEESWTPHEYARPIEETDAMRLGTLTHAAYYEPETITGMYAMRPEKNGKAVKCDSKEYAEWALANEGKMHVKRDEIMHIHAMISAVNASPVVQLYDRRNACILSTETSYLTEDPCTGLAIRIKPDRLRMGPDGSLICEDLKTTRAAKPQEFRREADIHIYHRRFAFYRNALALITGLPHERIRCVFVCVQNDEPHAAWVAEADPDKLDAAQSVNDDCMVALANCIETGVFSARWTREPVMI
jgi:hypothetical protein